MPKLLRDVKPDAGSDFQPGAISRNPELAALFAVVANHWTRLELELGRTLAEFLHTQPEIGVEIYGSITSITAKLALVARTAAVANPPLTDTEHRVLGALLQMLKQLYEKRNIIEHGMWGYSAQLPDALLRIKLLDFLRWDVMAQQQIQLQKWDPVYPRIGMAFPNQVVDVYYKDDFTQLVEQLYNLGTAFSDFRLWRDPRQSHAHDVLHQRLCTLPQIREILSPTLQESTPSVPKQSPPKEQR